MKKTITIKPEHSGLFAALKEIERKFGLPERPIKINLPVPVLANVISPRTAGGDHSGIRSIDENEARESTQPQPFDSAMSGDTVDSRGGQSNFSSVPVPDEPPASLTISGEARVGNKLVTQRTENPSQAEADTLGAAGNILSGSWESRPAKRSNGDTSSPRRQDAGSAAVLPNLDWANVTEGKAQEPAIPIGSRINARPAQDPFTPAMFRAMIRQQCLL